MAGAGIRWAAIAVSLTLAPAARAQEPFYKGKTLTMVIASNAGGGFDAYGRLLSRFLPEHLAGKPAMVVQNMPGAGSIRAANMLYTTAPRDGTTIGMIDEAAYLNQILGVAGLQADIPKFNWLGRIASNSAVLIAWHAAKVKTAQDLFATEMVVAASGSASRLNWTALNTLLGMKMRLITGYEGTAASRLAMERGEIDGFSTPWSQVMHQQTEWLAKKLINPILQTGLEKDPNLPDTPRMIDLAKDDTARAILEIFSTPSLVGRSVLAPPGVPDAQLRELREAFVAALADPAMKAEAESLQINLDWLPGEKLQAQFSGAHPPEALLAKAREIAASVSR